MFLLRDSRVMRPVITCLCAAFVFMTFLPRPAGADVAADRDLLTRGVHEIEAPGALAGALVVYGEHAFTVLSGRQGKCVCRCLPRPAMAGAVLWLAGMKVSG